jgi:hypothetical protein
MSIEAIEATHSMVSTYVGLGENHHIVAFDQAGDIITVVNTREISCRLKFIENKLDKEIIEIKCNP